MTMGRSKTYHRTQVQGTQGGIVCTCDCGDLYCCDFPSEVEAWKAKHSNPVPSVKPKRRRTAPLGPE